MSLAHVGKTIAGRYRLERTLGRGGTCVVEQVTDLRDGRQLALKRLLPGRTGDRRNTAVLLFQREYHVLAQLSHPSIIEALDYGVTNDEPYYTMELLDGSDLRQLAPMAWRSACQILLDICSSLALLHSRGLVHRDLTPANVRRTSDGRTKLIDFGAMSPMGQATDIVGTPPYMAPEQLHGEALDGRTDLYALGALGYWLLTARHAFPARKMSELTELWRGLPRRISESQADVPPMLEQLIMSLLSLDPLARPRNAAEVVQRLGALVGREPPQSHSTLQAYLTTPILVGRERQQLEFRTLARAAHDGNGAHLCVRSSAGFGRSRLLDAFALEGKLTGMLVARVRVDGLEDEEHCAVASLVRSIQATLPDDAGPSEAEHAAFASLPASASQPPPPLNPAPVPRETLYDTLDRWLLKVARRHGLLLLLDDSHLYDAASLLVLARWARLVTNERLLVISSVNQDAPVLHATPHQRLIERATHTTLDPLSSEDNLDLLASLFGDVAQLRVVADWTYRVAAGNPRMTMDLAQHLVDRGIFQFKEGAWHLPDTLEALSLPADFQQALDERVARLPARARTLAQGLCLVTSHAPLDLDEYARLLDAEVDTTGFLAALDALLSAQILVRVGERYALRHPAMVHAVRRTLTEAEARRLHLRLAAIYEQPTRQTQAMPAWHRYLAGDMEAAYVGLRDSLLKGEATRGIDQRVARSPQGAELYQRCLDHALQQGRSERDLYVFRRALLLLGGALDPSLAHHAEDMFPQLLRQSGLSNWRNLAPDLDPAARVRPCLQNAIAEHERTSPADRWLHPYQAVRELGETVGMLCSSYSATWDAERLARLPEIMQPLKALNPALAFLTEVCELAAGGIARGEYVAEQRLRLLDQLRTPIPGMSRRIQFGTRSVFHFYCGLDQTAFNSDSALDHAAELDKDPFFAGLASLVRMVCFLNRGEYRLSEDARVQMELHSLRNLENDLHFTAGLVYEAGALARFGDLLGLKRLSPVFDAWADRYPGWKPWALYVNAHYALARGEIDRAASIVTSAEPYMTPCRHGIWQHLYMLQARVLLAQDEAAEALAVGERLGAALAAHNVAPTDRWAYGTHLYLAMARAGRAEEAARNYDVEITHAERAGLAAVVLASCYEARARIAMCMRDVLSFRDYAARTHALLRPGGHPAAIAFFDRLWSDARKLAGFLGATDPFESHEHASHQPEARTQTLVTAPRSPPMSAKRGWTKR